jgi:hypothetical protein
MRRAILFLVLLGIIVALVMTVVAIRGRGSRVAALPNGARVEFLGTAVGEANFTTEKSWHKLARKVLPPSVARWVPSATSGNCSSGSNSVTFYFGVTDPTGAGSIPWSGYAAEDETGFRFNRGGGYCGFGGGKSPIYGLIVQAFPRRQRSFPFHFLDQNGVVLATLRVPNPVHGPFPQWKPQALPQTQTVGPVTLTLLSMREVGDAQWQSVGPKWHLSPSDPAWEKAKVRYTTFSDATGNEGQKLSHLESAWKARVLVFRERPKDFSAAERLVATNLSIPIAGNFVAVDQSAERQGVKLTALVLAGPGRIHITNGVERGMSSDTSTGPSSSSQGTTRIESWGGPLHFLLVEARDVQRHDEILVRLLDENGREIKLADSAGYHGLDKGGRMYKRSFTPPDGAKSLTLEVIVNRPLIFEFMVNPADVQPPNSSETKQ